MLQLSVFYRQIMKFILGKKQQMTQRYTNSGAVSPVTFLLCGSNTVTQVKIADTDGYSALQLGHGEKKKVSQAARGHAQGVFPGRDGRGFQFLREVRQENVAGINRGDIADLSMFVVGEKVTVIGTSKGRGFAGVVKRHHFHGHPTTHGHKDQERMPGSIGAGGNQHVFKGVRMAGRMGAERVTVKNLEVIEIHPEQGILVVKGAVPGARNSLVMVCAPGEFKAVHLAPEETVESSVESTEAQTPEPSVAADPVEASEVPTA